MDQIQIISCDALPEKPALNSLLKEYYTLIVARMRSIGVTIDQSAPDNALAEFWLHASKYLPPNGCLVIAKTQSAEIVGCGMLKKMDSETGELKRVYVTEAARGTGTGRKIIEMREALARQMGLKRLVADTLSPNVEMRSLYPKLGFREVFEPLQTMTYVDEPSLRPHMHFFVKDLT